MDYKNKLITVEQALSMVKSDDVIVTGLGAAEARLFMSKLHTIANRVKNVTTTTCLPILNAEYFMNPAYKDSFKLTGWFYTGPIRKAQMNGNVSFIPNHLHLFSKNRFFNTKPNIFVGNATMPDKHGYVSLSLSNTYEKRMIEVADLVIIEINPKLPRTFGENELHINDIDYMIETDYDIPEVTDVEPNEKDLQIGSLIAGYINDGDCIQLGIGGIPNAVTASLFNKKDLGVHTEMLTTGFMKLAKAGVITGKKKTINKGKMVATFAFGTRELYEFLDNNPAVAFLDGHYVNDPYTIGQNDNMVSINTTIEVDLTGQCASESIGHVQFSGTGGQADTAIGAQRAKNGRSFIALYSTALVKNPETGEREEISKIVPMLKPGAAVSLSRNDVDYVVTEYGVAALRGTSVEERVEKLITIAHPKFRDELRRLARELNYIN
ncbi:MAG: ach1 [Haloplasmataceae bacterium]|jgi:acyl-CoA hydrolase|nr:ach1 [Haloplasmataceae bacterium]